MSLVFRRRVKQALIIFIALSTVLLIERMVRIDVLQRTASITLEFEAGDQISVGAQYRYAPASPSFSNQNQARGVLAEEDESIWLDIKSHLATDFQFQLEGASSHILLRAISINSVFAPERRFEGAVLAKNIFTNDVDTRLQKVSEGVRIQSDSPSAKFALSPKIRFYNPILQYFLPLLIGFVVFKILSTTAFSRIPSLSPLLDKSKQHSPELDGLRGLAALSVVADHTWGLFSGMGIVGVWIFFALSGYLLSIPFVKQPETIFSATGVSQFYRRRLARILPMYYVSLCLYYVFSSLSFYVVPHFLFLQGNAHFWTIPQEMFFYLLLPLIMLGFAWASRLHVLMGGLLLIAVTLYLLYLGERIPLSIYGRPASHVVYPGWFLIGVVASFLLNNQKIAVKLDTENKSVTGLVGGLALITMLLMFAFGSLEIAHTLNGYSESVPMNEKFLYGLGAGFLVFAAVFSRRSIYGRILRLMPLRAFGIIGFSAYLLHPLLLEVVRDFTQFYLGFKIIGFGLFALTLFLTCLFASICFNLIEYPFLSKRTPRSKQ